MVALLLNIFLRVAWLAQLVEHQTFNLRVKGSSPLSGGYHFILELVHLNYFYVE